MLMKAKVMTKKAAAEIVGNLSKSAKMPETAHGTPAANCHTGRQLAGVAGSVCEGCYAMKGRCGMPMSVAAQQRREDAMRDHPQWEEAMTRLLDGVKHHRWFDTGDIPDAHCLERIIRVAESTPDTMHWLPTKEYGLAKQYAGQFPENLIVRVSMPMVDQAPVGGFELTSTVHRKLEPVGHACPAEHNKNQCGSCRACWDRTVKNVSYHWH